MAAAATNGEHGSLAFEAEAVLEGHTDKATFVAFGPDGAELAVCSFDHEVGVWEVAPGRGGGWRCAATLQGHRGVAPLAPAAAVFRGTLDGRAAIKVLNPHGLQSRWEEYRKEVEIFLAILHRDFKPSNVMLSSSGTAKLADMGLAKAVASGSTRLCTHADMSGSPGFIDPQQMQRRKYFAASDVYSVGVFMLMVLLGRT
eukprot:jgi/Tetstr1/440820/TSEL_029127.t1